MHWRFTFISCSFHRRDSTDHLLSTGCLAPTSAASSPDGTGRSSFFVARQSVVTGVLCPDSFFPWFSMFSQSVLLFLFFLCVLSILEGSLRLGLAVLAEASSGRHARSICWRNIVGVYSDIRRIQVVPLDPSTRMLGSTHCFLERDRRLCFALVSLLFPCISPPITPVISPIPPFFSHH